MRHKVLIALGALVGCCLAGCAHNDVMVFGTTTDIALDVQTAATQGASPSIVLGYKRNEAVWMPLIVNGKDSRVIPSCTVVAPATTCTPTDETGWSVEDAKYLAKTTTTTGVGPDSTTTTTFQPYSVFASLGAKFNGSANGTQGATAGGGLAQFFATGEAAVSLSQNDALVTVLKASHTDSEAAAQSDAVAAASGVPLSTLRTQTYLNASTSKAIVGWLYPGGDETQAPDGVKRDALEYWMQADTVDPNLNSMPYNQLIHGANPSLEADRSRAIADLHIH